MEKRNAKCKLNIQLNLFLIFVIPTENVPSVPRTYRPDQQAIGAAPSPNERNKSQEFDHINSREQSSMKKKSREFGLHMMDNDGIDAYMDFSGCNLDELD